MIRSMSTLPLAASIALALVATSAGAADMLKTNALVWGSLSEAERSSLRAHYLVDVADGSSFGMIMDAQAVDESTPGTTGGAALGGAIGSAMYVDNAFKGPIQNWNYSAQGHLGAALLGAVIGSATDVPAQRLFRFRYTIKTANGDVRQTERVSDQPFRQPIGVCVALPALTVAPSGACETDVAAFRARYLAAAAPTPEPRSAVASPAARSARTVPEPIAATATIRCKIGSASVIATSAKNCTNAQGEILR